MEYEAEIDNKEYENFEEFRKDAHEYDKSTDISKRLDGYLTKILYALSRKFNVSKTVMHTDIARYGLFVFRERIDDLDFKMLCDQSISDLNNEVAYNFEIDMKNNSLTKPQYIFKSSKLTSWNVLYKSSPIHLYKDDWLNDFIGALKYLGFDGRDGSKLALEFIILCGLSKSTTVELTWPDVHRRITMIVNPTIGTFEQIISELKRKEV